MTFGRPSRVPLQLLADRPNFGLLANSLMSRFGYMVVGLRRQVSVNDVLEWECNGERYLAAVIAQTDSAEMDTQLDSLPATFGGPWSRAPKDFWFYRVIAE